jgi:hypothetical protein
MATIHPFSSGPVVRPMIARRHPATSAARRQRRKAIQAYTTPPALAATVVPATLAALAAPSVQLNVAGLLPHVEALLAGPFGASTVALGCAVSAGIAATLRLKTNDQRKQVTQFLGAAGQAGLGAPLLFGALRLALGPATTATLLTRGVAFGVATILGAMAGRQAGYIAGTRMPPPSPPRGKVFSEEVAQGHRRDQADAARLGSNLGGLAAGAIVGIAALRAL